MFIRTLSQRKSMFLSVKRGYDNDKMNATQANEIVFIIQIKKKSAIARSNSNVSVHRRPEPLHHNIDTYIESMKYSMVFACEDAQLLLFF